MLALTPLLYFLYVSGVGGQSACRPLSQGLTSDVQQGLQVCIGKPGVAHFADDDSNDNYADFIKQYDRGACSAYEQFDGRIPRVGYQGQCSRSVSTKRAYTHVRPCGLNIDHAAIGDPEFLNTKLKCYVDKWGETAEWSHNGVSCDNIELATTDVTYNGVTARNQNVIRLQFRGDEYTGSARGVEKTRGLELETDPKFCTYTRCPQLLTTPGTRSGATLITNRYYGPGSFRVRARVPPTPSIRNRGKGYVFAIWNYFYSEVGEGSSEQYVGGNLRSIFNAFEGEVTIWNHEIDFEIPANAPQLREGNDISAMDWGTANFNTYITDTLDYETAGGNAFQNFISRSAEDRLAFASQNGEFHDYEFNVVLNLEDPASNYVDFLFDGSLIARVTKFVPTRAAPFYIGALPLWWSSSELEGGVLDFDTVSIDIAEIEVVPQQDFDLKRISFPMLYDQDFSGSCSTPCFKRDIFA